MAVNYNNPGGLFTRLRVIFDLLDSVATFQNTTLESDLSDILGEYSLSDPATYADPQRLISVGRSQQKNGTIRSAVRTLAGEEIVRQMQDHDPGIPSNVDRAIEALIQQMEADSETIAENTVSITVTPPSNQKPQLLFVEHEGLPDDSYRVVPDDSGFSISGPTEQTSPPFDWPPRGLSSRLQYLATSNSLLQNPGFDTDNTVQSGYSQNWDVETGVIGTTIDSTVFAKQRIEITGTPTSGFFTLTLTDADGNQQITDPLPHNPSASDIQSAITQLSGWEQVTVTDNSGNFDVEFLGVAGSVTLMTANEQFDTGGVTITDISSGETGGLESRSLFFIGDGAENTSISQVLTGLDGDTDYGFSVRLRRSAAATGTLRLALVDGTGAVVNGASLDVDLSTIGDTTFSPHMFALKTPKSLPAVVKFQMKLTTPLTSTVKVFVDSAILQRMQVLASSIGLKGLAFAGPESPLSTDSYTVQMTNDFAGRFQTYFSKLFGKQLPSSSTPTIPD